MNEIRIEPIHPPIPVKDFDYAAWRDGEDFSDGQERGRIGWGKTPSEAIANLLEQEEA